jgi:4'-phosphopantetheinyl transferase
MAVKFIQDIDNGLLGFWEITETTEQLLSLYQFRNGEPDHYLQFRNELRKREWLATRLLLQNMLGDESIISYEAGGKPTLLKPPGHLSISHSTNCVVIFYHLNYQPGIDIESITRNVERAAKRFLSPKELNDCTINGILSNKDMMLRWCAKEAVFKMVPDADVDFAIQIACETEPFKANEGIINATFAAKDLSHFIPLRFRLVGEIIMVWGTFSAND